ncbi:hypothetical protein BJN34_12750 [Cupriavidus necator]|uniref:Uncharacterized protein n=1 Tax=Cupriavidus necator TaxID=106590 RepID=A0A1U9UQB2_CUPNE|nr:hypothetical protein [Cupriavidus necator]AQV94749.1 hypothetical protein BJN34_12750 [Cupriavidus necator]
MFRQVFQSSPVRYRLPAEWNGIPNGGGLQSLYNGYLVTPPRIYAEEFNQINGLFVTQEKTPTADAVIVVVGVTNRIYWPGWDRLWWKFNAVTGEFMERGATPSSYYDYDLFQARDGSLWQRSILGSFFQVDPINFAEIPGTRREPSDFGVIAVHIPMVDRQQNLAVLYTSTEAGANKVGVYNWTTGALIRHINVGGTPTDILPEDERRCYVAMNNGLLNLVDYTSGEVLHTVRSPAPTGSDVAYAWDRICRRLLAFQMVPNAVDGACQSVIRGWYPVPLATHLTKPLPLRAPRKGRDVPVLVRAVGDAGEPIAGASVQLSVTGDAAIARHPAGSDVHGDSITTVHCDAPGTMNLSASATVEDGL